MADKNGRLAGETDVESWLGLLNGITHSYEATLRCPLKAIKYDTSVTQHDAAAASARDYHS